MKKTVAVLITILIFAVSFPSKAAAAEELGLPPFPEIESPNIVLMDADSGEVLFQKNGDKKCYPASTTKLLTALLTIENTPLSEKIVFSENAVKSISPGDANAKISAGEELTTEQALYCLMLRSANEVAYGIAEHVGGTISNFSSMMNDRVAALGAKDTHFSNPSGLTDEFHYTTAYDMALIARECFNNKTLMNILGFKGTYTIAKTNKSNFIRYYEHRFLMTNSDSRFYYEYSKGGKTGYTDAAGNCLVSFAEKDGLRLICSVMNSTDAGRYSDSIALFEYYFNNYKKISIDDLDDAISSSGPDVFKLANSITNNKELNIYFEDNSYLLVPKRVKKTGLQTIVTYADNPGYSGKEGGFACLSFFYQGVGVGNATVYIESRNSKIIPGTNGVVRFDNSLPDTTEKIIYINIFILIGCVIGISGLAAFIVYKVKNRKPRFGFKSTKKLHF